MLLKIFYHSEFLWLVFKKKVGYTSVKRKNILIVQIKYKRITCI